MEKGLALVSGWMGDRKRENWGRTRWPNKRWAASLLEPLEDKFIQDADLCDALDILAAECGFAKAVKDHGLHSLWSADLDETCGCAHLAAFCFSVGRQGLAKHLYERGWASAGDVQREGGPCALKEALCDDPDYVAWLLDNGYADRALLQESLESGNVFVDAGENFCFGDGARRICEWAAGNGLGPWDKEDLPDYPFFCIGDLDDGMALWLIENAQGVEFTQSLLRRMALALPAYCEGAIQAIEKLAMALEEKSELAQAQAGAQMEMASFGRLALEMIREGRLSLDGKALGSCEELVAAAGDGAKSKPRL